MNGSGAAGSADETDNQVAVLVRLDEELMVAIHQECELMEDGDIGQTIRRRLTDGTARPPLDGKRSACAELSHHEGSRSKSSRHSVECQGRL